MSERSGIYFGLLWPVELTKYGDEYDLETINKKRLDKKELWPELGQKNIWYDNREEYLISWGRQVYKS